MDSLPALIEHYVEPGDTLIEVGCGDATLAIIAAQRGAQGVLAIERDQDRLMEAGRNIQEAGVTHIVRLACGDFATWPLIPAKHVICNVTASPLLDLLPRLCVAARSGVVILSRVGPDIRDALSAQLATHGLALVADHRIAAASAFVCAPTTPAAGAYQAAAR